MKNESGKSRQQPGQGKVATLNGPGSKRKGGKVNMSIREKPNSTSHNSQWPAEGSIKGKGVTPATLYYPHQMRPKSCR